MKKDIVLDIINKYDFICPECGCMDFFLFKVYPVNHVRYKNGEWGLEEDKEAKEKGKYIASGFVCSECNHKFLGDDGSWIIKNEEIREWAKKNLQKRKKDERNAY